MLAHPLNAPKLGGKGLVARNIVDDSLSSSDSEFERNVNLLGSIGCSHC